jgi:hypothetical protein
VQVAGLGEMNNDVEALGSDFLGMNSSALRKYSMFLVLHLDVV